MKRLLTNNLLYKLISLVFAAVLWMLVVNISDPTVTRTISGIPVMKTEENVLTEQGKVYVVLEGNTASISVRGPRSVVDQLDADDFIAEAPFSELTNMNAIPIYVTHKYPKYEKSVEITQKTRTMVLSIENINTKYYDIEVNYIGTPASGYSVGNLELSENVVKVSAPESVLQQIERAVVDVDVTRLEGNMESELVIKYYDIGGKKVDLGEYATVSNESVYATVTIYQVKEVPITVSVTGNVAEGYQYVGTELSRDKVLLEGENIQQIDSIALPNDLLDITDATENIVQEIDLSQYLPPATRLTDEKNQKMVTITVQIEPYITQAYQIPVENIELRNLPEGMTMRVAEEPVTAYLVGLQRDHDEIQGTDLYGYVDLSEAKVGNRLYDVVLQLPEGLTFNREIKLRVIVSRETTTPATTTSDRETQGRETGTEPENEKDKDKDKAPES